MQNKDYQIIDRNQTKELAKFLSKEGQLLLPMLDLVQQAEAGTKTSPSRFVSVAILTTIRSSAEPSDSLIIKKTLRMSNLSPSFYPDTPSPPKIYHLVIPRT